VTLADLADRMLASRPIDDVQGIAHLDEACIGSISEIFDAEKPFIPRGCVAQAWSVAEVLRAWVKTATPASPCMERSP
jgi:glycogen debranching enzyme